MNAVETYATRMGRALRERRRAAGYSQERLARRIGCCRLTVIRTERGQSLPSEPVLRAWEQLCGPVVVL